MTELGRFDEARPKLERGLAIREKLVAAVPLDAGFRADVARSEYYLARLHVRAGGAAEALRHIEKAETRYAGIATLAPEDCFYRACLLALHVPVIGMGKTDLSDAERAEREQYAGQAIKALREAVTQGYKKKNQFTSEHDLDPLRSRAEFQKLIADLGS